VLAILDQVRRERKGGPLRDDLKWVEQLFVHGLMLMRSKCDVHSADRRQYGANHKIVSRVI
jgi:hypothetical protein